MAWNGREILAICRIFLLLAFAHLAVNAHHLSIRRNITPPGIKVIQLCEKLSSFSWRMRLKFVICCPAVSIEEIDSY
ncbi:hypothetical protein BU23DRAFT_273971 [Bimuria novae-zelandiae CBS 107.79]|uniref:Secreted protein n=1 Tax=Bimuria novae-zelandiae CBS 107.79 TaxID=1447943 RepID=A0A6A5VQ17_9PLEO|nr:hypothetical protein BU23DRAFT_273971 [Bimuria novae-zelandiae CBS 107.79]